jgi:hypothetical protein
MIRQNDDGQAHIRTMFHQFYEAQKLTEHESDRDKEKMCFCYDPWQYSWTCTGQKKMLVPHGLATADARPLTSPEPVNFGALKWEQQSVWVVDGLLHRGESNLLARRRFYIHETSWMILFGDGFDRKENLVKCYLRYLRSATDPTPQGRWYAVSGGDPAN